MMPFTRREFLEASAVLGTAGAWADEDPARLLTARAPMFPAKAKALILLVTQGGMSQMDTFDPKPELSRHHGKKLTPEILPGLGAFALRPRLQGVALRRSVRHSTPQRSTRARATHVRLTHRALVRSDVRWLLHASDHPSKSSRAQRAVRGLRDVCRVSRGTTTTAPSARARDELLVRGVPNQRLPILNVIRVHIEQIQQMTDDLESH